MILVVTVDEGADVDMATAVMPMGSGVIPTLILEETSVNARRIVDNLLMGVTRDAKTLTGGTEALLLGNGTTTGNRATQVLPRAVEVCSPPQTLLKRLSLCHRCLHRPKYRLKVAAHFPGNH